VTLYEAMILVTTAEATRDWEGIVRHISDILTRNGAEDVDVRKWGERRLAYEIRHQRKATYILAHFQAPPNVIAEIRRELQLSERILRHLILVDQDGVEVRLLSEVEEERERSGGRRGERPEKPAATPKEESAKEVTAEAKEAGAGETGGEPNKPEPASADQPEAETDQPEAEAEQPEAPESTEAT